MGSMKEKLQDAVVNAAVSEEANEEQELNEFFDLAVDEMLEQDIGESDIKSDADSIGIPSPDEKKTEHKEVEGKSKTKEAESIPDPDAVSKESSSEKERENEFDDPVNESEKASEISDVEEPPATKSAIKKAINSVVRKSSVKEQGLEEEPQLIRNIAPPSLAITLENGEIETPDNDESDEAKQKSVFNTLKERFKRGGKKASPTENETAFGSTHRQAQTDGIANYDRYIKQVAGTRNYTWSETGSPNGVVREVVFDDYKWVDKSNKIDFHYLSNKPRQANEYSELALVAVTAAAQRGWTSLKITVANDELKKAVQDAAKDMGIKSLNIKVEQQNVHSKTAAAQSPEQLDTAEARESEGVNYSPVTNLL
ncbi:hypothetical protein [Alteromonas antoniana]|uniref:hypothetical protein n=1 Tax=Alteromonas antoniana TaxID=2803813 RepID=UPI001C48997E|nr:hypothetical protein [Alteromonas antoniana]